MEDFLTYLFCTECSSTFKEDNFFRHIVLYPTVKHTFSSNILQFLHQDLFKWSGFISLVLFGGTSLPCALFSTVQQLNKKHVALHSLHESKIKTTTRSYYYPILHHDFFPGHLCWCFALISSLICRECPLLVICYLGC